MSAKTSRRLLTKFNVIRFWPIPPSYWSTLSREEQLNLISNFVKHSLIMKYFSKNHLG